MAKAATIKKRRAHRGRPADPDCARTDSGRKSRARGAPKEDPRKVAIEARQRIFGLAPEDAATDLAGSALGRLRLSKAITEAMLEAGEKYRILWTDARRALTGPDGLEKGGSPGVGGDIISKDWVDWATRVTGHYRVFSGYLRRIEAINTVECVVCHDMDPAPVMMPALHEGLLLLAIEFGMCREAA